MVQVVLCSEPVTLLPAAAGEKPRFSKIQTLKSLRKRWEKDRMISVINSILVPSVVLQLGEWREAD